MMAPDDPTLGELWRRIDDMQRANIDQLNALRDEFRRSAEATNQRLDRLVSVEVHQSDLRRVDDRFKNVEDDVTEIKAEARKTHDQAKQARQWAIGAAIAAAGVIVAALGIVQGGVGG